MAATKGKFHYNPKTQKVGACRATKQPCKLLAELADVYGEVPHFPDRAAADAWLAAQAEKENRGNEFGTVTSDDTGGKVSDNKPPPYFPSGLAGMGDFPSDKIYRSIRYFREARTGSDLIDAELYNYSRQLEHVQSRDQLSAAQSDLFERIPLVSGTRIECVDVEHRSLNVTRYLLEEKIGSAEFINAINSFPSPTHDDILKLRTLPTTDNSADTLRGRMMGTRLGVNYSKEEYQHDLDRISNRGEALIEGLTEDGKVAPRRAEQYYPESMLDAPKGFRLLGSGVEVNAYLDEETGMVFKVHHEEALEDYNPNRKQRGMADDTQRLYGEVNNHKLANYNMSYLPTMFLTREIGYDEVTVIIQPYLDDDRYIPGYPEKNYGDLEHWKNELGINDTHSDNVRLDTVTGQYLLMDCLHNRRESLRWEG